MRRTGVGIADLFLLLFVDRGRGVVNVPLRDMAGVSKLRTQANDRCFQHHPDFRRGDVGSLSTDAFASRNDR